MTIVSHHKLPYGSNFIEYSVVRSNRLKTSEIIVDEKGVVIRVPANKPDLEIHNILRRKRNWIIAKKQEYLNVKKQIKKSSFKIGSTLPYLGKNYRICKGTHNSNEHLELRRGQFVAFTNDVSQSNLSNLYKKWLELKSEKIFRAKVGKYSKKLNLHPRRIIIKDLKDRWGSVTKEGDLNLNVNLLKAPADIIEYIIAHELCHFVIKEHTHHFWDFLGRFIPSYKVRLAWLENNASSLVE